MKSLRITPLLMFMCLSCSTNTTDLCCTGHAEGLVGCYDCDNQYQLGVFIVTDNGDSLLSFNKADSFYTYIDPHMHGGPYVYISTVERIFQYSYLEGKDTISWIPPLCDMRELPLNNAYRYRQIKITHILE